MTLGLPGGLDRFAALLPVAAFALVGWKIFKTPPAAPFAAPPRQDALQANSPNNATKATPASKLPLQQPSPDGRFRFDAQFVSSAPGQAVHAASLVELRDGCLRAVWFSGSREGDGDVVIRTAVMDAASQRWGEESTLIDRRQIQQGLWRYVKKLGNPVIARAPDGSLRPGRPCLSLFCSVWRQGRPARYFSKMGADNFRRLKNLITGVII